jgi:DNA-directed RNA polymerase I and III subunit RPAC1
MEHAAVKVVHLSSDYLELGIEDVDVSLVNAIRRVLLSEVPNVALDPDRITISKNTCSLHNEFLSHRLSLIPLCFDPEEIESYNDPEQYKFVIKAKNTTNGMMSITTKDISIYTKSGRAMPESFREKVFPKNKTTDEYIIITKLKPNHSDLKNGDELLVEAYAVKSIAKTNACWCPVSLCTYFNQIDHDAVPAAFAEYKQKHNNLELTDAQLKSRFDALEIHRCFKKNAMEEPSAFTFKLQSECRMTPDYLFVKAIDVIRENLMAITTALDEMDIESVNGMNIITMRGYDHTLGNFLQAHLYNMYVKKQGVLDYIGYYQPHPLEKNIVVKLRLKEHGDDAKGFLKNAIGAVIEELIAFEQVCQRAFAKK